MDIKEITEVIAVAGRNLLPDVASGSKPKIYGVIGCPNPMSDELLIKLRHLASKGGTVVFLRDDVDLNELELRKVAELILVDSLPLPEPSDLERITKEFVLFTHEHLLMDPELLLDDNQRVRNYFVPRNLRIPANCRKFNRFIGLNRKVLKK